MFHSQWEMVGTEYEHCVPLSIGSRVADDRLCTHDLELLACGVDTKTAYSPLNEISYYYADRNTCVCYFAGPVVPEHFVLGWKPEVAHCGCHGGDISRRSCSAYADVLDEYRESQGQD